MSLGIGVAVLMVVHLLGSSSGVCQLVNKMEENSGQVKPFNRNDEQFLEAFVIFCGLGIQNTQMYEAVERAMAKQMVTLEVGNCSHIRGPP